MELKLGHNEYTFADSWEQLKPAEYLMLCQQLMLFANGETTVDELRAMYFCSLADIDFKRKDNKNDQFWENIYRASREFTFFLKIKYEKNLHQVPKELRKALYKTPPTEVNSDDPVLRWVKKLKYSYIIDAAFAKQLLPAIKVNNKSYYGYKFSLNGKLLNCSLTAKQFIDATMALDAYMNDNNEDHMCMLVSILYGNSNNPEQFKKLDAVQKFAVLLNFQAVVSFITKRTHYSIIWNKNSKKLKKQGVKKISIGVGDSIYSLAKLGYGSIDEIGELDLIQYLDLLLKNIVDSVKYLHDNEQSVPDIADKTGVPIETINQII